MSVIIPITVDAAYFDLVVDLEGVSYTLEFRWNTPMEAWFMAVYDDTGATMITAPARLVSNWPFNAYAANRQPPGAFFCVDTAGVGDEPGFTDLGVRHQLYYLTAAELSVDSG
jgi:hypothetical protein